MVNLLELQGQMEQCRAIIDSLEKKLSTLSSSWWASDQLYSWIVAGEINDIQSEIERENLRMENLKVIYSQYLDVGMEEGMRR